MLMSIQPTAVRKMKRDKENIVKEKTKRFTLKVYEMYRKATGYIGSSLFQFNTHDKNISIIAVDDQLHKMNFKYYCVCLSYHCCARLIRENVAAARSI